MNYAYIWAAIIVILIVFVSGVRIMAAPETFYSSGASMRQSVDVDSTTMQGQDTGEFNNNELQYYISHTP